MNTKIINYVDALFSDIPNNKEANELKEEILSNMSERYEDYIKEGKTENQAFSLVIGSLGDIDEMLVDVMPNDDFLEEAHYYRTRNATYTAASVVTYIIGAAFLIGLGGLGEIFGKETTFGVIGLIILLILSAIATGIIIYTNMSTPSEFKDYNKKTKVELENLNSKSSDLLKNIMTIYWTIITVIYLGISFTTGLWGITWIIWILASIFEPIMKIILGKKRSH